MKLKLIDFIKEHSDWEALLSQTPYCLNISRDKMFGRNLIMFKYNQIESDFSNDIVKECRGVILDEDSLKPISIPYFKFFNFSEPHAAEIDWSSAIVTEKIDGCVKDTTLIKTTSGDVEIKEICANPSKYQVLTYNHETNEIEANDIDAVSIKNDTNATWYELELEDSTILTVTGNHQIWCENLGCYRRVDELDGTEELIVK